MATISVFQIDANGDIDPSIIITDGAAVAQIIGQRLRLLMAEWWEDRNQGLPLWQVILAAGNQSRKQGAATLAIQQCILNSPYVIGINELEIAFNSGARGFKFYAVVQTAFGPIVLGDLPAPPAQAYPNSGVYGAGLYDSGSYGA